MKWIWPPLIGCVVVCVVFLWALNRELDEINRHMVEQLETMTRIVDRMNEDLK